MRDRIISAAILVGSHLHHGCLLAQCLCQMPQFKDLSQCSGFRPARSSRASEKIPSHSIEPSQAICLHREGYPVSPLFSGCLVSTRLITRCKSLFHVQLFNSVVFCNMDCLILLRSVVQISAPNPVSTKGIGF